MNFSCSTKLINSLEFNLCMAFFGKKRKDEWAKKGRKSEKRMKERNKAEMSFMCTLFEWLLYFIIASLPYLVNVYNFDLECFYENYDASFFRAFPSSATLLPAHTQKKTQSLPIIHVLWTIFFWVCRCEWMWFFSHFQHTIKSLLLLLAQKHLHTVFQAKEIWHVKFSYPNTV